MTLDLHALSYVLSHAYDYPKPPFVKDSLADMAVGHEGLLTVEADVHRRQRKILVRWFIISRFAPCADALSRHQPLRLRISGPLRLSSFRKLNS